MIVIRFLAPLSRWVYKAKKDNNGSDHSSENGQFVGPGGGGAAKEKPAKKEKAPKEKTVAQKPTEDHEQFRNRIQDKIEPTSNEFRTVNDWKYSGYTSIRQSQRAGETDSEAAKKAQVLEGLIDKKEAEFGQTKGNFSRGMTLSPDELAGLKTGMVYSEGALSSWTSDERFAKDFAKAKEGRERVILHAPGFSGSIPVPAENEHLVSSKAKFIVDKIEQKDGYNHVYLKQAKEK